MLGWLFPRSPLGPVEKAWTETHMLWLANQFGVPRLLSASVLPTHQVVSDDYRGTLENAHDMLTRLCEPLEVAPAKIHLEVATADCGSGSPAEPQPNTIHIADQLLANPFALAATLAREVTRLQLPLQHLAGPGSGQLGWLIDLAAVYLGWGVVVAHELVGDQHHDHGCGCGSGHDGGQLPARMMGYALALFAHTRGELRPAWKTSLRLDAQSACDRSLKYLRRTDDTLFNLDNAGRPFGARRTSELLLQLKTGSHSARVAALWELRDASHAQSAAEPVSHCLHDRLAEIREEAAETLGAYGPVAKCALPSLIELLEDHSYSIRATAARSVGAVGTDADEAMEHLAPLLRDADRAVVLAAARSIEGFGEQHEEAVPWTLSALRGAMIRCDHELIDALTHALYTLDPDPTERVMEHFQDDPEMRQQVVHIMVDALRPQNDGELA